MKAIVLVVFVSTVIVSLLFCNWKAPVASGQALAFTSSGHESSSTFSVVGPDLMSGTYPYTASTGVCHFLDQMGINRSLEHIEIIRVDDSKRVVSLKINLHKIRQKEIPDFTIRAGDTIYLPKHGKVWNVFNKLTFGILRKVKS